MFKHKTGSKLKTQCPDLGLSLLPPCSAYLRNHRHISSKSILRPTEILGSCLFLGPALANKPRGRRKNDRFWVHSIGALDLLETTTVSRATVFRKASTATSALAEYLPGKNALLISRHRSTGNQRTLTIMLYRRKQQKQTII